MTDQRGIVDNAHSLVNTPDTDFNVTEHIGVVQGNSSSGSSSNWRLFQQRLTSMITLLSPDANKSLSSKQKQKGLLAIAVHFQDHWHQPTPNNGYSYCYRTLQLGELPY
jgi:hypothetical protein